MLKLLTIPIIAVAAEETTAIDVPAWVPAWMVGWEIPQLPLEHADKGIRGLYEGWYTGLELVDYHIAHQECLDNNINRIRQCIEDTMELW